MDYNTLGKTGLEVSRIGLGSSQLGNMYRDIDLDSACNIVQRAFELGINFVDSSPYYGNTKAESVLGQALKKSSFNRNQYFVATKVGRYGEKTFDFSRKRVHQSVEESLKRLQLEYVDLIQCHDIEFVSLDQIVNETLPALQELQKAGKVRHIGVTGLPLKIFDYVLNHPQSRDIVESILSYCHYTLQNTCLQSRLLDSKSRPSIGIINGSPLAMGLLTQRGPPDWHPAPPSMKEHCKRAADYCTKQQGDSIETIGFQFAVHHPGIHTTLTGAASVDEVESIVKSYLDLKKDPHKNSVLIDQVRKILEPVKDKMWPSGLAENNDEDIVLSH